ncbi:hypothetical protein ES332_D07G023600v1 [Gossypium tomentosum]|uniref:Uncharacterized protein n=1 Tax=Gossypium tomentosum TaxID=34277 RepID=A0A5D2K2S4_GOSTO|nr:hypothetical protein ES332_D07G023600v1 [Gossypium tomentosum]
MVNMRFPNGQLSQGSKWVVLLFKVGFMGMMMMIMVPSVTSMEEIGTPSAGLLCISECSTCPVICSPPPAPPLKSFPPPSVSVHHTPPPDVPYFYYTPMSPQTPQHSPPPSVSVSPPPSPPRPPSSPPAPSSKGSPPPPFKYFYNEPSGQGPPTTPRQYPYPYPYYYYYSSKASSLSVQVSISPVMLLFFNAVLFYC